MVTTYMVMKVCGYELEHWRHINITLNSVPRGSAVLLLVFRAGRERGVFAWLILLFFKRKRKLADIFINTQVLFILVDILFFMMGVVNFDIRIDRYFPITTIFDFIFLAIVGNYLTKSKKGKAVFIN